MSEITWTEVDLNAIEHNLKAIKSKVGSGTKILSIVKADAYGHGAVKASQTLEQNGTDMFGVAFPGEGIELRKNNRSEERRVGKECRSRWSPYH